MGYLTTFESGIFWDYENVPLRHRDFKGFLKGLRNFISNHTIFFARVYVRERTITERDQDLIDSLGVFDYKFVNGNENNAVDYIVRQSCYDALRMKDTIKQALIITGDGDFSDLLSDINNLGVQILLIYQQANYNERLFDNVNNAFSVNYVVSHARDWWET